MTIASEITNYANGLSDAYDAVNDMSGIIPTDKNMNNLDTAIRTIPQNQGATTTTFYWGGSPNYSMYKDSGYTTVAAYSDIATAYTDGLVFIADGEDETTYVMVSDIPDAHTITVTGIGLPDNKGGSTSYAYASSTWTKTATTFQDELTAGSNISIVGSTISATDTTYSDFTGATSLADGAAGLVPKPLAGDETKFLSGNGQWTTVSQYNLPIASANDLGGIKVGTNLSIDSGTGVLSATDTTYSDFTGATSSIAGAHGLVPAPAAGDEIKFLKGDGTWETINGNNLFYAELINFAVGDTFSFYTDSTKTTVVTYEELLEAAKNGSAYFINAAPNYYARVEQIKVIDNDAVGFAPTDGIYFKVGESRYFVFNNWNTGDDDIFEITDKVDELAVFNGATSLSAGTSGLVPGPNAGDQDKALKGDGTWGEFSEKFVIMKYGEASAWSKFIDAYNNNKIVYCRASSNANPATGAQTRLAFMAYVNDETTPTEVEFQYVRSVGTKTSSQPVDQVFVYKLTSTNGGTWSVQTRDMAPKLAAGTNTSVSYSSGTYTVSATDTTYSDFAGATSSVAGAAGLVPAPTTSDPDKFLKGDGTWGTPTDTTYTAGNHIDITSDVISAEGYIWGDTLTSATTPTGTVTSGMIADGTIQATDIATGVVPIITMTTTDPGEGSPLAANNFIAVYEP